MRGCCLVYEFPLGLIHGWDCRKISVKPFFATIYASSCFVVFAETSGRA